ncbi:MAG: trigger factor [Holosporales bacterium]|jgi:trigger factor|nr:trigger factor [Holosporales bacterium]
MKFENIKSDGMKYEYKILLSADEVEEGIVSAVEERAKTFRMQGFRVGHVPLNIVRNSVESAVIKDVFNDLVNKAYSEIVKDLKITDVSSRPVYKFEKEYEKGKDVDIAIVFDAAPSFDLKSYDIEVTKIIPKVSSEEIENAKKAFMANSPVYEKADDNYAIKPKDEVSYKAICYVNGIESKKKSFQNTIIIPETIPDDAEFLKSFLGKNLKDSFDFVSPTDKNLKYKIIIKSVKKAVTEISEEDFAKQKGFKDANEFFEAIKKSLENEIEATAFLYHKNQILETLEKQYKFELPQNVIDLEMKNILAEVKRELAEEKRKGTASEEDLKKTDDDLKKEYEEVGKQRVLLGYILNKIAKEENIVATDDELNRVILSEINRNPSMGNYLIDYYSKNPSAITYKRAEIIEHKVISFLISKAKIIEEVEKTKEEVEAIVKELLED